MWAWLNLCVRDDLYHICSFKADGVHCFSEDHQYAVHKSFSCLVCLREFKQGIVRVRIHTSNCPLNVFINNTGLNLLYGSVKPKCTVILFNYDTSFVSGTCIKNVYTMSRIFST